MKIGTKFCSHWLMSRGLLKITHIKKLIFGISAFRDLIDDSGIQYLNLSAQKKAQE